MRAEPLIFRHAWAMFILATCLNGAIWWAKSRRYVRENPALGEGYRRLIRGWLIWMNIPWLVMGLGTLSGGIERSTDFVDPSKGPAVWAFIASVVVVWIAGFYWLFARGGAEELQDYPGFFRGQTPSPVAIKFLYALIICGGFIALIGMFLTAQRSHLPGS